MAKSKYPKLKKSGHKKPKSTYIGRLVTKNKKYVALAVLLVGGVYGCIKGYKYVTDLPYFDISGIWINGNKKLNHSQIRQLVNLGYQQSIFEIDTETAALTLETHPYIKHAWVSINLPSNIEIKIQERTGFALINSGSMYIVDEEGVVLEQLKGKELPNLPVISGVAEAQLLPGKHCTLPAITCGLRILSELKETNLLRDVSEVNLRDAYNPVFYTLKDGIEIRLGEGQIKQKLNYMKTVWQNLNARIKEVDFLDLRYKDMVVVKFKQIQNMV